MESWNPLTDTVPIHSWVHPWLPLMQARLEPLYSPIRSKLASALQKWHPSDSSAKLILQPWKDVFTPGSWEAFMVKNIVPKLGKEPGKHSRIQCGLLPRGARIPGVPGPFCLLPELCFGPLVTGQPQGSSNFCPTGF